MIRFILAIIIILILGLYSIFDAIVCLFINDKKFLSIHNYKVVKFVIDLVLRISGVKIVVDGIENYQELANEKGIFVISNHRGYFDILSGYVTLDRDLSIVAKTELKKLPIVGYWMKRIGCLFLDRDNLRSGANMVIDAIGLIKSGKSVWVFPEGTRNKNIDPTNLLEFKSGTFKIPEKSDCFVLPMAILNADNVFENQIPIIKPGTIYIGFGKAYKVSELADDVKENIAEHNRILVKELLVNLKNRLEV